MNTEYKDADLGMEDSGVGSSCSSSVSDAQSEPLDNLLDADADGDGDDAHSAVLLDSEDDETLPFMQVSKILSFLFDIIFNVYVVHVLPLRFCVFDE